MNRLQKKCLVASGITHGFLVCLLVFGSAFFVSSKKAPPEYTRMRVVPTMLVDAALSGGGGNPKLKPSDEQQKGSPTAPVKPPQPQPPPPKPQPKVEPVAPAPPAPVPAVKPKPVEAEPKPIVKKEGTKPVPEPIKKPTQAEVAQSLLSSLKPAKRGSRDIERERAKAREAQAREWAAENQRMARRVGETIQGLQRGFEQGTVVEAPGPGGAAYANYADWVRQIYDDAWTISDLLTDEESTVRVSVTIAKTGHVVNARIERRSGSSALDKSVQRALDKVKFVAPFPDGSRDQQRTFRINFNLKTKRLAG